MPTAEQLEQTPENENRLTLRDAASDIVRQMNGRDDEVDTAIVLLMYFLDWQARNGEWDLDYLKQGLVPIGPEPKREDFPSKNEEGFDAPGPQQEAYSNAILEWDEQQEHNERVQFVIDTIKTHRSRGTENGGVA